MKAIIHIGAEKTGTTSIQNFCAGNRALLAQVGVLYPSSLGLPNQTHLAAYAMADRKIDDIRRDLGIFEPNQVPAFRREVHRLLARDIDAAKNASSLLFSNEHLQSRLLNEADVVRLRELLSEFASEFKILVYLRRQDRVAVSHYSTKFKAGNVEEEPIFPPIVSTIDLPRYYDYNQMLHLYERVFGIENVILRIFETRRMVGGSLISDFLHACDIPERDDFVDPRRRNESLSEAGLAFFRRLNTVIPRFVDGKPNPKRGEITGIAGKHLAGPGPAADRDAAESFYEHFRDSNRSIAERYFPTWGGKLFDDDFSSYDPDANRTIDADELINFAIQLWLERTERLEELRLAEGLKRFELIARNDPAASPGVEPTTADMGSLPRELLSRYVGALLYSNDYERAAAAASEIAKTMKAKALFVMAEACAYARGGNTTALQALIAEHPEAPRLVKSISGLAVEPFRTADRDGWLNLLKMGDAPQAELYQKCLAWLR